MSARDHLFVSFARDDWALAEWLTLRLTREGYRLWCSRFPVLGGESYPRQVEEAIATRAFRVLVLVSRAALSDANTMRDSTLALELGRQREESLLVPLLVNDVEPTSFDGVFGTPPRISFCERWETGLTALLATLTEAGAPRPVPDGERVADEARQFLASRRSWHTVL